MTNPQETNGNPVQATLVTFLLDRTGSMDIIKNDTVGGFNAYVDGLRDSDIPIEFSLVQFSSEGFRKTCVSEPIKTAPRLDEKNYVPSGGTPLIEAAYKTIQAVAEALTKRSDKPKVIVCIQTDGEENASDQSILTDERDEHKNFIPLYSWVMLKRLVEQKTAEGWQFNFIGTGIDAYQQSGRMGISAQATVAAGKTPENTRASYRSMGASTMRYAKGLASTTDLLDEEAAASGDVYRSKYVGTGASPAPGAPPAGASLRFDQVNPPISELAQRAAGKLDLTKPQVPPAAPQPPSPAPVRRSTTTRSGLGTVKL